MALHAASAHGSAARSSSVVTSRFEIACRNPSGRPAFAAEHLDALGLTVEPVSEDGGGLLAFVAARHRQKRRSVVLVELRPRPVPRPAPRALELREERPHDGIVAVEEGVVRQGLVDRLPGRGSEQAVGVELASQCDGTRRSGRDRASGGLPRSPRGRHRGATGPRAPPRRSGASGATRRPGARRLPPGALPALARSSPGRPTPPPARPGGPGPAPSCTNRSKSAPTTSGASAEAKDWPGLWRACSATSANARGCPCVNWSAASTASPSTPRASRNVVLSSGERFRSGITASSARQPASVLQPTAGEARPASTMSMSSPSLREVLASEPVVERAERLVRIDQEHPTRALGHRSELRLYRFRERLWRGRDIPAVETPHGDARGLRHEADLFQQRGLPDPPRPVDEDEMHGEHLRCQRAAEESEFRIAPDEARVPGGAKALAEGVGHRAEWAQLAELSARIPLLRCPLPRSV